MATSLFLTDTASDLDPGAEIEKSLLIGTRGSGVVSKVTNTAAGPTAGVQVTNGAGGTILSWLSPPITGVTISGTVTFNMRMAESATQANTGAHVKVERCDSTGAVLSTIINSERGVELGTSEAAQNWTGAPTSTALTSGDRLKITVFGNDAGGNMASGRNFTLWYNGTTAAASGDCFVTFNETITEYLDRDLTVAHIGPTASVHAPTVALSLTAPHIGPTAQVFAPDRANLALTMPVISSTQVHAPTVAFRITAPHIGPTSSLHTPTLSFGVDSSCTLPVITNTPTLHAPSVARSVSLPVISSTQLHAPSRIDRSATAPHLGPTASLHAPAVTRSVTLPLLTNTPQLFAPVQFNTTVTLPIISGGTQLRVPSVLRQVTLPLLTNAPTLHAMMVAYDINLAMPVISSTVQLYAMVLKAWILHAPPDNTVWTPDPAADTGWVLHDAPDNTVWS